LNNLEYQIRLDQRDINDLKRNRYNNRNNRNINNNNNSNNDINNSNDDDSNDDDSNDDDSNDDDIDDLNKLQNYVDKFDDNDDNKKNIRIATVDNYQGEECNIILLDLVRNNKYREIGFLKDFQRMNVSISRAKHGMIILGNQNTLSINQRWKEYFDLLYKNKALYK